MNQQKTKKSMRYAALTYVIFLVCAYSLKLFLTKMFGLGIYEFYGNHWAFYHLTIILGGALFSSAMLIDFKVSCIASISSYFLGLIIHAIIKAINPSNNLLLSQEGLYQRLLIITIVSIVVLIAEMFYKSYKSKKIEKEKREILKNKLMNLQNKECQN